MASVKHMYLLLLVANAALTSSFLYSDDDKLIPYSTIRMRRRLFAKRRHRNICNLENDEKNDEKLREVVAKSDYVFTGKVISYYYGDKESKNGRSIEKRESEKREKRRRLKKPHRGPTSPRNKSSSEASVTTTSASLHNTTTDRSKEEGNAIEVNLSLEEDDKPDMFVVELKRIMKGGSELSGIDRVVVRVPKEFVSGLEITSDPRLNVNCIEFHPVLKVRQTAILLTKKVAGNGLLELTYFPVAMTLRHLDRVDAAVTGKRHVILFPNRVNLLTVH